MPVARGPVLTILQNISRNAIEAMPDGGKLSMEVSLGSDSVMIVISDTGCGLDEIAKSRMFEPFWTTKGEPAGRQADSVAGQARPPGLPGEATGLGLAIAHGLTRMIGGSISVDSKVGEGASFRITLPIHEGA